MHGQKRKCNHRSQQNEKQERKEAYEGNGKEDANEEENEEEGLHVMPLTKGAKPGTAAFKRNIEAEIAARKPVKQAVAIAYSEAGEKRKPSNSLRKR